MWQLLMAKDYSMMTLPVGVSYLALVPIGERAVLDVGLLMTWGTLCAIPMIFFFLYFERYFVEGPHGRRPQGVISTHDSHRLC